MEKFPRNEQETSEANLKESAQHIADMYIRAAEQYLEEGDPLKDRIINYYSTRTETEQELLNVLGKKSEIEILDYLQAVRELTGNPSRFIERMEKLYELQDTHQRRRELVRQDRSASAEEYELGAYVDVLESQVRDAVLAAQKKGYRTFQSGFREKSERDQFIDFYNKNILIPQEALKFLQEHSVEVNIENLDDRTTLTLHPTGTEPIRLTQWKEIWNALIASLPLADNEMVENMKTTSEHADFRTKQDLLIK